MIAKTPAVVVQPAGTADVVAAVEFARDHGLALSVRGGGHNIAGTALADGGVTIDMSRLRDGRRRPGRPHRHGAARLPARRRRPRDAAPRARDAARLLLRGRRRRADARRRPRLPDAPVRLDGRQPARGRDRHRRRPRAPRQPRRERRPVLGRPRRRREPRRRHLVHVPPARGRPDRLRRADRVAVRARGRVPAHVPHAHDRGAARADGVPDDRAGARRAVRAAGVARPPDLRAERLLTPATCATPRRRSRRSGRSAIRSSTCCTSSPTRSCSPTSTPPSRRAGTTTGGWSTPPS